MGKTSKAEEARAWATAMVAGQVVLDFVELSRAARKRIVKAQKTAKAASRHAENRKLVDLEQAALKSPRPGRKAERERLREEELRREEDNRKREAAAKKLQSRTVHECEYIKIVRVRNSNLDEEPFIKPRSDTYTRMTRPGARVSYTEKRAKNTWILKGRMNNMDLAPDFPFV